MTTISIEDNSPQAKKLLENIETRHQAMVVDEKKHTLQQAVEECNAVSVDEFFDELDHRIKKRFNHA